MWSDATRMLNLCGCQGKHFLLSSISLILFPPDSQVYNQYIFILPTHCQHYNVRKRNIFFSYFLSFRALIFFSYSAYSGAENLHSAVCLMQTNFNINCGLIQKSIPVENLWSNISRSLDISNTFKHSLAGKRETKVVLFSVSFSLTIYTFVTAKALFSAKDHEV